MTEEERAKNRGAELGKNEMDTVGMGICTVPRRGARTMRYLTRLLVLTALLAGNVPTAAQSADVSGSKDHPFFSRLPNFNLAMHDALNLGRHSFMDGKGEDRTVDGRKFVIRYELAQGGPSPSISEIIRHYAKTAEEAGGSIYEYTDHTLFLNFVKEGKEIWAEVSAGEDYYTLTIVEKSSQPETLPSVQLGTELQPAPTPGASGVSAPPTVPGPAGAPPASPAGPSSAPGRVTPPRGSMTPLPRFPDLAIAAIHQRFQQSWRAVSPSPDIDVLIRNNGGDYAGPMKIHVRSYSRVPVPPGQDPHPETQQTFYYERVEIPGGDQKSFGMERAIKVSSTHWGCRRQVIVTLDRQMHNDANPGNNTLSTTFFQQTGIGSELSPLREVEMKAESDGDWRRVRTNRTHRLRPGIYTVRFRLVSCSRTDQKYYLDMGKGSFQWVTVPAGGEAPVEMRFELPDKQKNILPMKWYRPRWDEDWKDARTLFNFSYDTNPEKSSSP